MINRIKLLALLSWITLSTTAQSATVSALLKNENSYLSQAHQWQKQEWQLDVEFNTSLGNGEVTTIGRILLDAQDQLNATKHPDTYSAIQASLHSDEHFIAELRELYWTYYSDAFWKIGKQQVVWGEADGLKLLDVVNPQSYREFILDDVEDSRIPLWMIKTEIPLFEESTLQILWIPDTTVNELAPQHSPYVFTSPLLVPNPPTGSKAELTMDKAPGNPLKDSDAGFRFSTFWEGWDLTLNYLYHTVNDPIIRTYVQNANNAQHTKIFAHGSFERSHLIGGSASTVIGNWTLRTEIAFETDRFHRSTEPFPGIVKANQFGSVIGLDYQGWTDQFISAQWFQTHIFTSKAQLQKAKTEDVFSALWESKFLNETLTLRLQGLSSLDHNDGVLRPKVTYNLYSNLDIYLSMDRFYGNGIGLFGQFEDTDRVNLGFKLGLD